MTQFDKKPLEFVTLGQVLSASTVANKANTLLAACWSAMLPSQQLEVLQNAELTSELFPEVGAPNPLVQLAAWLNEDIERRHQELLKNGYELSQGGFDGLYFWETAEEASSDFAHWVDAVADAHAHLLSKAI